jgi:transcriptional regulator
MYIPKINEMTNKAEAIAFMQRFGFATIVTAENNVPLATHLPFFVLEKEGEIILTSHFAKANEQWKTIENNPILVIFTEPHAYISPKNYEKVLNVPTWNYVAVHCYGQAQIKSEPEQVFEVLEKTILTYEPDYLTQWNSLPDKYKDGMAAGIVAFEIKVTDLQAKEKLSQNKTENERKKIISQLSKSADTNEKLIADFMQEKECS